MRKGWIAAAAAALALVAGAAPASAFTRQSLTLPMDDGVSLGATLYLPDGAMPAGGWPAIVMFHGLGGRRADSNSLAEKYFLPGDGFAVLTFDARAHGDSGGIVTLDGPREMADVKALFAWLAARPDVADAKIGAWGISYGGGAIWRSTVEGVRWAAIETVETWTDLYATLFPQDLAKSGVIVGFLAEIPELGLSPFIAALKGDALANTNLPGLRAIGRERSSLPQLGSIRTPAFLMPGRRDFAFGIEQASLAYAKLKGPKRMWIGGHGHAPSTFPAADTPAMMADGKEWFDHFLRGVPNGIERKPPVVLAPVPWRGKPAEFAGLPPTMKAVYALSGSNTIASDGKVVRSTAATTTPLEAFGAATVKVRLNATGGWSRLVAVLTATTPAGTEIVVSGGGARVTSSASTLTIRLIDHATLIPKGSKLTVTLGTSSLAQNPGNLLYLDLPLPAGAKVAVGNVVLTLPVLKKPVSK